MASARDSMEGMAQDIGVQLRLLRTKRGLTQAQAAKDIVTRNMLSLMENGSATPSLTTLRALAARLDVPVGYFFAENEEERGQFLKLRSIRPIREAFTAGRYLECLHLCDALPMPDAEIDLLRAECRLARVAAFARDYALASASAELQKAVEAAAQSPYAVFVPATAEYTFRLFDSVRQEAIPPEICSAALYPDARVPAEMFAYATALRLLDEERHREAQTVAADTALIGPGWPRMLLEARLKHISGDPEGALAQLSRISGAPEVGFFTRYHALSAMEHCARDSGDYKNAYQYSTRKVHLLEQFSH